MPTVFRNPGQEGESYKAAREKRDGERKTERSEVIPEDSGPAFLTRTKDGGAVTTLDTAVITE